MADRILIRSYAFLHDQRHGLLRRPMKPFSAWFFLTLLGGLLLFGCIRRAPLPVWVSTVLSMSEPIGTEEIFSLPEEERIPFDQLLADIETAKVIFVGESHDQIEHHEIELKILQGLLEKGKKVVVGMEMFQRSQQPVLDRWGQGLLTEGEFLKEIHWKTTWGIDYDLYKGILDEVRKKNLKLIGLNVERELVRKVAEKGIEGLLPEDKRKLPEMDLADKEHRAYVKSAYRGHRGGSAKDFKHFYEAQTLWDEGMAETLSDFLRSPEAEGKTLLVFAGRGHIVFGLGIPKRLYRREPVPYVTIVLKEWSKEADKEFTFAGASSSPADFVWITRPNPPEKRRPRIGIVLKTKEGVPGLSIEQVMPGSPAEKVGLLPGDQLIAVEGIEIKEVKEIHHALTEKGWGNDIIVTVLRDEIKKEIKVTLPPFKD